MEFGLRTLRDFHLAHHLTDRYQPQYHEDPGSDNFNFYNNSHFENLNRGCQPIDAYCPPYVPPHQELEPAVWNNFVHEQGKMNQKIFEQMQALNENLAKLVQRKMGTGSSSGAASTLPGQPTNPNGEPAPKSTQTSTAAPLCGPQVGPCGPHTGQTEQNPKPAARIEPARDKGNSAVDLPPHRPPVPFPQRLSKQHLGEQFSKSMDVIDEPAHEVQGDKLGEHPNSLRYNFDHLSPLQDELNSDRSVGASDRGGVASGAIVCGPQRRPCGPARKYFGPYHPDGPPFPRRQPVFAASQTAPDGSNGPAISSCGLQKEVTRMEMDRLPPRIAWHLSKPLLLET